MHACMKAAVEARMDCGLEARITARNQYKDAVCINPETAVEVVRSDDAGRGSRSDAGRNSMMDIQQILLSKMELLVVSSQDFRSEVKGEMREGFAAEAVRRQEDNNRLR